MRLDLWTKLYHYDYKRRGRGAKVPNIHMPKWAARIWLRVEKMRVERVQDISEADAIAEGVTVWPRSYWVADPTTGKPTACLAGPIAGFAELWDSMYKDRGFGFDTNCYVWVTEFEEVKR
jgi:hypothetical protein